MRLHDVHARVEQDVAHREREVRLGAHDLQAQFIRLVQRLVAAVRGERQRQPRQSQSRLVPQNLRLAEINHRQRLAVRRDEEVSRVGIAVKLTQGEDLHAERLDEFADERAAVHGRAGGGFHPLRRLLREIRRGAHPRGANGALDDVRERFPLDEGHRHHALRAELVHDARRGDVGHLASHRRADDGEHARLAREIKLQRHLVAILAEDAGVIEGQVESHRVRLLGRPQHVSHVHRHETLASRVLNLHRDFRLVLIVERGDVHLRDGRRRQRLRLERRKHLAHLTSQLALDDAPRDRARKRRAIVEDGFERGDVLRR